MFNNFFLLTTDNHNDRSEPDKKRKRSDEKLTHSQSPKEVTTIIVENITNSFHIFNEPQTKWISEYNSLMQIIKTSFQIICQCEAERTFTYEQVIATWKSYEWLHEQINTDDEIIKNIVTLFFETPENVKYIIGFIRSGFVSIEKCKIISTIREITTRVLNTKLEYAHEPDLIKTQIRKKRMLHHLTDIKQRINNHINNNEILLWKQCNLTIHKIAMMNRYFKQCSGILTYKNEREAWIAFHHTDEMKFIFEKCRKCVRKPTITPRCLLPSSQDYVIDVIEDVKNKILKENKTPTEISNIYKRLMRFKNNYANYSGRLNTVLGRSTWEKFVSSDIYKNYMELCERNKHVHLKTPNIVDNNIFGCIVDLAIDEPTMQTKTSLTENEEIMIVKSFLKK